MRSRLFEHSTFGHSSCALYLFTGPFDSKHHLSTAHKRLEQQQKTPLNRTLHNASQKTSLYTSLHSTTGTVKKGSSRAALNAKHECGIAHDSAAHGALHQLGGAPAAKHVTARQDCINTHGIIVAHIAPW